MLLHRDFSEWITDLINEMNQFWYQQQTYDIFHVGMSIATISVQNPIWYFAQM